MISEKKGQPFSPSIEEINGRKFIVNKHEKIYNVIKLHNTEVNDEIKIDKSNRSISIENFRQNGTKKMNKKLMKTFNYDDLLLQEDIFNEKLLSTFVNRILIKNENFLFISINKGLQRKSRQFNNECFNGLLNILYGKIDELINGEESSCDISLRLNAVEVNEFDDDVIDLCEEIDDNKNSNKSSNDNQLKKYRINNLKTALDIINKINNFKSITYPNHRVYTIQIYQRFHPPPSSSSEMNFTNNKSFTRCSNITWLQLNLTKRKLKHTIITTNNKKNNNKEEESESESRHYHSYNRSRCVSLSSMSRYITGSLSRIHSNSNIHNNHTNFHRLLNSIFFDQYSQNNFFCFMTHLTNFNDEHTSDALQLLQFSHKITRLKQRLRTYMVPMETDENGDIKKRSKQRTQSTSSSNNKKTSDIWNEIKKDAVEVASISEMSCVETVVFNGQDKKKSSTIVVEPTPVHQGGSNSDDESHISRKLRANFISDSDSGCKDVRNKIKNSRKSSNENLTKIWPKSALIKAHKARMSGQETWVDGPINFEVEIDKLQLNSNYNEQLTPKMTRSMVNDEFDTLRSSPNPTVSQTSSNCYKCVSPQLPTSSSFDHLIQPLNQIPEMNTIDNYDDSTKFADESNVFCNDSDLLTHEQTTLSRWYDDINRLISPSTSISPYAQCCSGPPPPLLPLNHYDDNFHGYHYYDAGNTMTTTPSPMLPQLSHPYHHLCYSHYNYHTNDRDPHSSFIPLQYHSLNREQHSNILPPEHNEPPSENGDCVNNKACIRRKSFLSRGPLHLIKKTLMKGLTSSNKTQSSKSTLAPIERKQSNNSMQQIRNQELRYLEPSFCVGNNNDDDDDDDEEDDDGNSSESSSESECNEWFRNVKTFKSPSPQNMSPYIHSHQSERIPTNLRPPSAPLPSSKLLQLHLLHRHSISSRIRSNSSGYGSVLNTTNSSNTNKDQLSSELSSLTNDSGADVKQNNNNNMPQQFTSNSSSYEHLDPDAIAEKCEALVKQEKAYLLIQNQEIMISEFNTNTRPLLSKDKVKYKLTASVLDQTRLNKDPYYLDELDEETTILRDTIAYYKSLVHLESSFITPYSPANKNSRNSNTQSSLVTSQSYYY